MWYWMAGLSGRVATWRSTSGTTARSGCRSSSCRRAPRRSSRSSCEWNERPEHRFYHYDYYRDNCSTRVRDALDRVAGRRAARQTDGLPTGTPTGSTPSGSPPTIRRSTPGSCSPSGSGSIGPFRPGRRCSCRSRCGSTCASVTVPGPDGARCRSSGRSARSSSRPARRRPTRPAVWLRLYLAVGARPRRARPGCSRGARATQPAGALRLRCCSLELGAGGGPRGGRAGGSLGAHRPRDGRLQREPAADESAGPAGCCRLVPGAGGTVVRRSSRAAWRLVVAGLSLLGLVLQAAAGALSGQRTVIALALPAQVGDRRGLRRLSGVAVAARVRPTRRHPLQAVPRLRVVRVGGEGALVGFARLGRSPRASYINPGCSR